MRFLLINPYYPISETPSPPLGLAYLAAALENAGIEVEILDLVVYPYSKAALETVLTRFQPHFVGATAVTMNFNDAVNVLHDVKSLAPEIPTVMGGPHVTFCATETLETYPQVDMIVLGEGEETIVELARTWKKNSDRGAVKGLVYREGDAIKTTPPRSFIKDVDTLPQPARHLLLLGRYRALGLPVSMTTSRGCPFHCIFCVGRKMVGARVRYRNPVKVVDELAYLGSLDFHQINVADDLFTASKSHCLAVCDEIIKRDLNTQWTAFGRVDTACRQVFARMKQAGCTAVSFGVESGDRQILKTIRKGITLDQVIDAVNICNDVGIIPQASFILGLPGETPETLQRTVAFAEELKDMSVLHGFHLLAPFPGTEVRQKCDQYGIRIMSDDWRDYHANKAIVRTASVSRRMLNSVVAEWQAKFDQWLDDIKQRRDIGKATDEEAWPLTNLEHTVLIYDLMMKQVIEKEEPAVCENQGAPDEKSVTSLVRRLSAALSESPKQIRLTIQHALDRKYLTHRTTDGSCRWEWMNYL